MKRYRLKKWSELNFTQKIVRTIIGSVGLLIGIASAILVIFMVYVVMYASMPINAF